MKKTRIIATYGPSVASARKVWMVILLMLSVHLVVVLFGTTALSIGQFLLVLDDLHPSFLPVAASQEDLFQCSLELGTYVSFFYLLASPPWFHFLISSE